MPTLLKLLLSFLDFKKALRLEGRVIDKTVVRIYAQTNICGLRQLFHFGSIAKKSGFYLM